MSDNTQLDLFDLSIEDHAENPNEANVAQEVEANSPKRAQDIEDLTLFFLDIMAAKRQFSEDPELLFSSFKRFLQYLVELRYFSYVDCYFADFLTAQKDFENAEDYLGYGLLILLLSRAYGLGHTALPHDYLLMPDRWLIEHDQSSRKFVVAALLTVVFDLSEEIVGMEESEKELQLKESRLIESRLKEPRLKELQLKERWQRVLAHLSLPLVRTDYGIYLERNYAQEGVIVDFFQSVKEMPLTAKESAYVGARLDHYFQSSSTALDWQKFAAANAILNNISVISGGPGTGKTTTVFKILQTLIDLHHYRETAISENLERDLKSNIKPSLKPFTILLAAPTGKAAARLSESILGQVRKLQQRVANAPLEVEEAVRAQLALIPYVGQTLHRLLAIHPFTRKPRYNRYNPLNFDLLVVDEASMIDQQMLVQLIGALPAHGRVIFLGDKDQLASVEAGAIMHELCVFENYSAAHFARLSQLLPQSLPEEGLVNPKMPAFNYLSFLKKSYRFNADSALGQLAKIVNNESHEPLESQFTKMMDLISAAQSAALNDQAQAKTLAYTPLPIEASDLKTILLKAFKPYMDFLKTRKERTFGIEFAEAAFAVFSGLGVLSARRTGNNGAIALNELIRKTLFPEEHHREFFHGLPIMITHNSVENNLFNGDIGLILKNESGQLRAYFEGVDSARVFSIHALPKFETAFAMTIHKSQGSEFQKIMLFLGEEPSLFLTKELFYTGITRARESVHIFANEASMKAALSGRVDRFSFIHQRLRESSAP